MKGKGLWLLILTCWVVLVHSRIGEDSSSSQEDPQQEAFGTTQTVRAPRDATEPPDEVEDPPKEADGPPEEPKDENSSPPEEEDIREHTSKVNVEEPPKEASWEDEEAFVQELSERMKPHDFACADGDTADPHQFLHLHHMKTGGTSVGRVISCALNRLHATKYKVPSYRLSECGGKSYQECISDERARCRSSVESSAVMTYCAPLFQSNQFDWQDSKAVTVLRHPVDRVWSMFRFETRRCYLCMELKDFYAHIDNNTVEELFDSPDDSKLCVAQLLNHQTRNLLTSPMSQDFTEDDQLEEALFNLKNRFTVVGLTEELPQSVQMMGEAFPWLAESVEWSDTKCTLPHANSSPKNNYCGPKNTHWDLPDEPDEETRMLIEQHNQQDLRLYEAAVQHFELEKRALGWEEEETD